MVRLPKAPQQDDLALRHAYVVEDVVPSLSVTCRVRQLFGVASLVKVGAAQGREEGTRGIAGASGEPLVALRRALTGPSLRLGVDETAE